MQILDLGGTNIRELPQNVGQLTQLKCLRFDGATMGVLDWTNLASLEELRLSHVFPDFLKELGKLTELREFKANFKKCGNMFFKDLMGHLVNLQKLQVIEVGWSGLSQSYFDHDGSVVLGHLRHLTLRGLLHGMPVAINSSCLPNLCHLSVYLKVMEARDMVILGRFPELITLQVLADEYIVFPGVMDEGAFPKLRFLDLENVVQPRFVRGAMSSLEYLELFVLIRTSGVDFHSLENLPRLKRVDIHGTAAVGIAVLHANLSLEHALDRHPNNPTLKVRATQRHQKNSSFSCTVEQKNHSHVTCLLFAVARQLIQIRKNIRSKKVP